MSRTRVRLIVQTLSDVPLSKRTNGLFSGRPNRLFGCLKIGHVKVSRLIDGYNWSTAVAIRVATERPGDARVALSCLDCITQSLTPDGK